MVAATQNPPQSETLRADRPHPSGAVDPNLVEETRSQIRQLIQEIAQLAQSDVPLDEFYDSFLTRVIAALAATGGAVWAVESDGRLRLQYQSNLAATGLTEDEAAYHRHHLLIQRMLVAGEPALAPPNSGAVDDEAANPTEFLLIAAPVKVDREVCAIIEIFQRPGGGPATHRGYLRFLTQMCEHAGGFVKTRRLRRLNDRQALWEQFEQFVRQVHRSLDPRKAAFTIANEGRRLIECDRLAVAMRQGRRCRVEVVSGLDTLNRRASEVKLLSRLASVVVASGEPLFYDGDDSGLAPQTERALHAYIDRSLAKSLAIVPLVPGEAEPADDVSEEIKARPRQRRQAALGAVIVENFHQRRPVEGWQKRVEVLARHSADALANAQEHHRLFLLPLWKLLGRATSLFRGRALFKTLFVVGAVAGTIAGLTLTPWDFALSSRGVLQPQTRRDIFAGIDGVVMETLVRHGQQVRAGQTLARLRNNDLEVQLAGLEGKQVTTREQIRSTQHELLHSARLTPAEQTRLQGELAQHMETAAATEQELQLLKIKAERLVINSPLTGQVATWQVHELLAQRPVRVGDVMMTVVDPSGEWELELRMPERRMGHLLSAQKSRQEELRVTFTLAAFPERQFHGRVVEIHEAADVRDDEGNTVLVRVAIDDPLPDVRPGATAQAKVHCGTRPLGYVLFHEVLETAQQHLAFWLPEGWIDSTVRSETPGATGVPPVLN